MKAGSLVTLAVTFGEAAQVTGSPELVLNVGGQEIRAKYVSGSGTQVLRFEFITGSSLDEAADLAGAVYALQGGAVSTAAGRALPLPSSAGTDDPIRLTLALADNSGLRGSDPTRLQFRAGSLPAGTRATRTPTASASRRTACA